MYIMSLAGGITAERALLCSLTHSSINFLSLISGRRAEHTPESRIIQTHSNMCTLLTMLDKVTLRSDDTEVVVLRVRLVSVKLTGNYTPKRNRMYVLRYS